MAQCRYCPSRYVTQAELEEHERECSQRPDALFETEVIAAKIVDGWHEEHFGMRIEDWKLDELKHRIAGALVGELDEVSKPDAMFTCRKCEANYSVGHLEQPVTECPVCGWRPAHISAL